MKYPQKLELTDSTSVETVSNTGDNSAHDELGDPIGTALKSSSNTQSDTPSHDTHAPTKLFANNQRDDCTQKAPLHWLVLSIQAREDSSSIQFHK